MLPSTRNLLLYLLHHMEAGNPTALPMIRQLLYSADVDATAGVMLLDSPSYLLTGLAQLEDLANGGDPT